jgi:hypothetical protein
VTKIAILGAAIAVPYLLWTAPDSGTPRWPARQRAPWRTRGRARPVPPSPPPGRGGGAAARAAAVAGVRGGGRAAAVRADAAVRAPGRPAGAGAEAVAEVEEAPPEPEAAGPERPDLRFFGTVRQGGKMAALVTGESGVERLRVGDTVGDWQVAEVTRDRLVLVYEDEKLAYEIFGKAAADDGED